jgi:hypothetical protein
MLSIQIKMADCLLKSSGQVAISACQCLLLVSFASIAAF